MVVAGVGGIKDCIGKGLRGSEIGELSVGDVGKSLWCQVPGIKAIGKTQVAVNVTPYPAPKLLTRTSEDKEMQLTNIVALDRTPTPGNQCPNITQKRNQSLEDNKTRLDRRWE